MNSKKIASISLSLLAGSHFIQAADNDRPNIIFIMSDDHTSQAISAYNGILKDISTVSGMRVSVWKTALLQILSAHHQELVS